MLIQQSEIKTTKMEDAVWEPDLSGDGNLPNRPINRVPIAQSVANLTPEEGARLSIFTQQSVS